MSLNIFEIIIDSERYYNNTKYEAIFENKNFNDINEDGLPNYWTLSGLQKANYTGGLPNYDFTEAFVYKQNDLSQIKPGESGLMMSMLQYLDLNLQQGVINYWMSNYKVLPGNHGMTYDKSTNLEDAAPGAHGYSFVAPYDGVDIDGVITNNVTDVNLIPGMGLNSRSSSYLSSDILEVAGVRTGSFVDGDYTGWTLGTGITDESNGVDDYLHIATSGLAVGAVIATCDVSGLKDNTTYEVTFERVSGSDPFEVEVVYNVDELYEAGVAIDGAIERTTSSGDTDSLLYFTTLNSNKINLRIKTTANPGVAQTFKLNYILLKEVYEAKRVPGEDDFSYLPNNYPKPVGKIDGLWGLSSLDSDRILNYGSYRTFNVFKKDINGADAPRSCSVGGAAYGNSNRFVEIITNDWGLHDSVSKKQYKHFSEEIKDSWFFDKLKSINKKNEETYGNQIFNTVMPPSVFGITTDFSAEKHKSLKIDYTIPAVTDAVGNQAIDSSNPSFSPTIGTSIAAELLSDTNILNTSAWTTTGNWSKSKGELSHSGTGSGVLSIPVTIQKGKAYVITTTMSQQRNSEVRFGFQDEWTLVSYPSASQSFILDTFGSGFVTTTLEFRNRISGLENDIKINFLSVKQANKINTEDKREISDWINSNVNFTSNSNDWTGDFLYNSFGKLLRVQTNTTAYQYVSTETEYLEQNKSYLLQYKLNHGGITHTVEVYDGNDWIVIPNIHNRDLQFELNFTGSSSSTLQLRLQADTASTSTTNIMYMAVREIYEDSLASINSTNNNLTLRPSIQGTLSTKLCRLKLIAGQEYRFVIKEDDFSSSTFTSVNDPDIDYTIKFSYIESVTFSQENLKTIASISRSEGYADSDGSGKILSLRVVTPAGTEGNEVYTNIIMSISGSFPGKRSDNFLSDKGEYLEFEYIDFRTNRLEHAFKSPHSVGAYTSPNKFIVTNQNNFTDFGVAEVLFTNTQTLETFAIDSFEGDFVSDKNIFTENSSGGSLDMSGFMDVDKFINSVNENTLGVLFIDPINDCPKDFYGFYTGGSATAYFYSSVVVDFDGLSFFADNISGNECLSSKFRLNKIEYETHENNYITKSNSVTNAFEFYYNPLKAFSDPIRLTNWAGFAQPGLNPGSVVNVSWDLDSISGSPITIKLDDNETIIVDSAGTGSKSLLLKSSVSFLTVGIAGELDSYSLGSESLTNPSFVTNSDWTLGTSWTHSSYFQSMAVASGISEPSTLANRYAALSLIQYNSLVKGQEYEISINVQPNPGGILNGGLLPILGFTTGATELTDEEGLLTSEYTSSAGVYKYRGVAVDTTFIVLANKDFVGFLQDVSVKPISLTPILETTATLNSLNLEVSASDYEIKSEKWGDETSNNQDLLSLSPDGKNLEPYQSSIRLYSTAVGTEEPIVITDGLNAALQLISPFIDYGKALLGDDVIFRINIPYMNSGNTVGFRFNGVQTDITSEGVHEVVYSSVNPDDLDSIILFDITPGTSAPLDVVIESLSITIDRTIADKEPVRLDLLGDFGLSYNLSKKDFNSLDKISGDYSKTIELPATSNNKKALNFSGELNTIISNSQKDGIPCLVKSNGENIFEGLVFLNETNIDEHGQTILNASIRSGNSVWAEELKSRRLRDLSSNLYEISPESIVGVSFDDNETESKKVLEPTSDDFIIDFSDKEIVFPLIDNGRLDEDIDGNQYIGWDNVKAAYRISNVMFKIFEDIGYSLESEFFKSGTEWSTDVTSNFSSYIQNLVGIAPSISYTDEEVANSELDLSYNFEEARNQGINVEYGGVEDSLAKCEIINNDRATVKPAMHSELLNKDFGLPLNYYACDYAFIRFSKINLDNGNYHSYDNITGDSIYLQEGFAHDGSSYSNNQLRKKIGTRRSNQKSFISVSTSGYYDTSFSVNVTVSNAPSENKFTVALLKEKSTNKDYYRSKSSYGAEFFDLQDDSYITFEASYDSYKNAKISFNRVQYLKAGERYYVVALYAVQDRFGYANSSNKRSFSVYDLNMNMKLCKDVAPMKGRNNIIYTSQADPKASYKNVLPDVSSLDFVKEVSKIFNLIWDVDEISKNVIAEPFEDFYRISGDVEEEGASPIYQSTIWRDDELDSIEDADTSGYISPPDYGVFYPTWTSSFGSVYSAYNSISLESAVRLEPEAGTVSVNYDTTPTFYLSQILPTVAGEEYKFTFKYETNSPLKLLVGNSVGSNSLGEVLVHGTLSQTPTTNDYSRDRFSFKFRASSTETYITFKLPHGRARAQYQLDNPDADVVQNAYNYLERFGYIQNPHRLYADANLSDFIVTPLTKTYVDWTDKSVITSVKENSLIKSNFNYKMLEDSSDYEVNIEKSGSLSSLFGDKFLNTGFSKLNEDENISLSIFSATKMSYSRLINNGADSILLPRIWTKPESKFEPSSNQELPLPNNSHEHKLALLDGVKFIENGHLNYGLNSLWNYKTDWRSNDGEFSTQKAKAYSYLSASSYSLFDEDSPNLTFSSDFSKGLSKSLFDVYHKPLMDMLAIRDKIAIAEVHLTSAEIAQLDFRNLIHINGNIYILNKVKDFNFSGNATEVELLLVTPTK